MADLEHLGRLRRGHMGTMFHGKKFMVIHDKHNLGRKNRESDLGISKQCNKDGQNCLICEK